MIEMCRRQHHCGDGPIAEDVSDLWEQWMRQVDAVLDDGQLLQLVFDALAHRCKYSLTRGRKGTPAEVVLRLLVLNAQLELRRTRARGARQPGVSAVRPRRCGQGTRCQDDG